jgi:hypothetical protein
MTPCPKPKTVRLKGAAYKELRRQVWKRAGGLCERCGAYAPLYNSEGWFDIFECGHLHHAKSRGAGGQDVLSDEVEWICFDCHSKHHGPIWGR